MGYYTFISNSKYSAKGTADQNYMRGVQVHNQWGILGIQLFNGLLDEATSGRLCHNGEENYDVNGNKTLTKNYNKAHSAFLNSPSKDTAKALTEAYNAFGDPSISTKRSYEYCNSGNNAKFFKNSTDS